MSGCDEAIDVLLQAGACVNYAGKSGLTALLAAAGNETCISLLLGDIDQHYDMDFYLELVESVHSRYNDTALSACDGKLPTVNLLLQAGADVNCRDHRGVTALMDAARLGHVDVLTSLLQSGAQVNAADSEQRSTALIKAACKGNHHVVDILIRAGADVDDVFFDGSTALSVSARRGYLDIVKLLIQAGASVDHRDVNNCTPLSMAALKGHVDIVRVLAPLTSNINQQDTSAGCSALHKAIEAESIECVKILLEYGADPNICDNTGCNAYTLALRQKQQELTDLLHNLK